MMINTLTLLNFPPPLVFNWWQYFLKYCSVEPGRSDLQGNRNPDYLKLIVSAIVRAICDTSDRLRVRFPQLSVSLEREVSFITTQELEDLYPDMTGKEREDAYLREHKTACLMQIGGKLRSGKPHDGRAPDYDDWHASARLLGS